MAGGISGCASMATPVADTFCAVAQPVLWDPADTRETKVQADREFRKFKALCMAPKPQ